ncbi:DUF7283 family protein [Halosegnis longus]|uniref:Uncharacterized protein n=1 Tax=Halosegnis longus TaxID=2216012 RepID=A0AAJ4R9W4_9EURY|nr:MULTISPECIES: hypothetical protein [Halobacteriales]RNJ26989.1 hypothetical protein Nmn1133_10035 [Salella cibi]
MFDTAEGWYSWVGVSFAAAGLLAVALALPTAPPPDARAAATVVDGVADSDYAGRTTVDIDAARLRLTTRGLSLAADRGRSHARFDAGPIVPVHGGPLRAVLDGADPRRAFDGPGRFAAAVEQARARTPAWRPAPESLSARQLTWGETRVTLVG